MHGDSVKSGRVTLSPHLADEESPQNDNPLFLVSHKLHGFTI